MRIALTAMDQVWENKQANLTICKKMAESASRLRVDLLIFPEMTLTGFTLDTVSVAEELAVSESAKSFSDIAGGQQLGVIAGMVLGNNEQFQNCALAFGRSGEVLGRYAKVHPFSPSGESLLVSGGTALTTFEYEGLNIGLTICYDLRFPMLWHSLADRCDCIVNIASWPARRVDHWRTLLKARAIENQVYVVGVNRIGIDGNGLEYEESSIAFAPDGSEVVPAANDGSLHVIEIERSRVKESREAFPVRNDRKRALYSEFLNEGIGS